MRVSGEKPVAEANRLEMVRGLMWIANRAGLDIANAARAAARRSHNP